MLSIVLKGTNGCNLACSYCSLGNKNNVSKVTKEKMYDIMRYSCELCKHISEKNICFILHGGEPTIISSSTYGYTIDRIKNEYKDLNIEISLQTNGYNLSEEWIDFFERYDVSVGVSVDGSALIHDRERITINGENTFAVVKGNIDKLLEKGIRVSCLMVLTSNALNVDYSFLEYYAEKKLHLKVNPLLDYGEVYAHPELSLKRGQYAAYLIGMYEYILTEDTDVNISPIDKILQGVLRDDKRICECSFNEDCNKHFLCIDFNGDIYPCGKFSDMGKFRLGNIIEENYNVFESALINSVLARRGEQLPPKCKECRYVKLCHAGCNAEACLNGSLYETPAMCDDYFKLFDYFTGRGLFLLKEELVKHRERIIGLINNGI